MERQNRGALATTRRLAAALTVGLCAAVALPARGHESEQYTLPAGRDFADLGPHFSRHFAAALHQAVADINTAIDAAQAAGDRPAQVQALQSADRVAAQVWARIFVAYPTNELLDLGLLAADIRAQYPGLVTSYRPVESIYDDPLLMLDLSKPVRAFFRAGTVSAGGVLFGTDKIIHFINVGRIYHVRYLVAVEQGLAAPEATQQAVTATAANPLLSEDGLLGLYTTGIRSNGDLAADYAGLKFYRNLTEAVHIGGRDLPPMLQRDGEHWRVVVQDEDTLFTRFVSPHWNEVLNPNSYLDYVGARVREVIGSRCDDVADWFRDHHGQPLGPAWFAARQRELATFDGEPYGHELPAEHPVSVADICIGTSAGAGAGGDTPLWWAGALPGPQADGLPSNHADGLPSNQADGLPSNQADGLVGKQADGLSAKQADGLGRSALWWAAAEGRSAEVERLAARGEPLDSADVDGETPLLAALRLGHLQTAALLVARGADIHRAAHHGVTPLQLTVAGGHVELSAELLRAGADPNAQDRFGRTALYEAAQRGDLQVTMLLLRHGADATLASRQGHDALQVARRMGHEQLLQMLRASAPVQRKFGAASDQALAASSPRALAGAVASQPQPAK